MRKKLLHIAVFVLGLLYCYSVSAQSKVAYLKAGDDCLLKSDAFCAISNYRLALDYGDDDEVFLRLGIAEKTLHNYTSAISWFIKCQAISKDVSLKRNALLESADLYKRLGMFNEAYSCLNNLITNHPDSLSKWNQLLVDYKKAEELSKDSLPFELTPEPGDVNTAYSDFAPASLGDSILYYSSLRYFLMDKNEKIATSRIATVNTQQLSREKSKLLPATINQASFNDANASISPDGKLMVFTRCLYEENGKLKCALYESKNVNGQWQEAIKLPEQITPSAYTSTQPCITTNKTEGYLLFYSSNRKGGQGGMDIWYSKRNAAGQYDKAINPGSKVNSSGDEWSPFYDIEKDSLYFSTEKNEGLGGLDLYITSFSNMNDQIPRCLPRPINSGYNDLYYTRSYGTTSNKYLVTNRPPATRLNGSSCCYDIFRIVPVIPTKDTTKTDIDTLPLATIDTVQDKKQTELAFLALPVSQKINAIKLDFPIRLYFDNDHPDPRSLKKTTDKKYDELAQKYLLQDQSYRQEQQNDSLKALISGFFKDSVESNYQRLNEFTEKLSWTMASGEHRLKITIKGSASPLAERRYNLILSERRIQSLKNYWLKWKDGRLEKFIDENKLVIEFIPAGEEEAAKGVSDNFLDRRKSIFSKEAALERKIELIDITIIP